MIQSRYNNSLIKRLLDITVSTLFLIITSPLILLISFIIKITGKGPVFFLQKRVGKNGKVFRIIKFRTMKINAERIQRKYMGLNEADGLVFKIRDDPRYTTVGKILAHTGFDELPQLINVLKSEMSLVGPRPLPVIEAKKLSREQKIRELVKPGITSSWVVLGNHNLTFNEWMNLDRKYVKEASLLDDISILFNTSVNIFTFVFGQLGKILSK